MIGKFKFAQRCVLLVLTGAVIGRTLPITLNSAISHRVSWGIVIFAIGVAAYLSLSFWDLLKNKNKEEA